MKLVERVLTGVWAAAVLLACACSPERGAPPPPSPAASSPVAGDALDQSSAARRVEASRASTAPEAEPAARVESSNPAAPHNTPAGRAALDGSADGRAVAGESASHTPESGAARAPDGTETAAAPLGEPRGLGVANQSGASGLLGDLLGEPVDSAVRRVDGLARRTIDATKAAEAGIRRIDGKRLTLYTDLPSSPEVDRLGELFDQAFPQYCAFFGIDPADLAEWRLTGFLIKDKQRFVATGLVPEGLPAFGNGYARNEEFWLYDQPSDYYRRHLVLHEGVHCFMNTVLGACGPPWYMEGIAELLATHQLRDGRLRLGTMPADKHEVEYWGRIKLIRDAFAAHRARRFRQVMDFPHGVFLENESYAWAWAAAALLDGRPAYHDRFRRLSQYVLRGDFNRQFEELFADDWAALCDDWQVFIAELEYGYDPVATAIDFTPGRPLPPGGAEVTVRAAAGWQNTGVRLEAGRRYQLSAAGRYQVANRPRVWWCEPGGVSIRYYAGRPLGILLGAVRPDAADEERLCPLVAPEPIGLAAQMVPRESGTLMVKINDSPAELGDNAGELRLRVEPAPDEPADDRPDQSPAALGH